MVAYVSSIAALRQEERAISASLRHYLDEIEWR